MLVLRRLEEEDIEIVAQWLHQEYISKWFGDASDWLHEINERNHAYRYLHHFIVQDGDARIGFCQYYDYNDLP